MASYTAQRPISILLECPSIDLLDGEQSPVKTISIDLTLNHQSQSARINFFHEVTLRHHCGVHEPRHELRQYSDWERLGAAIGDNTTVRKLELRRDFNSLAGLMDRTNDLNAEVQQCIELLFRGIQSSISINKLEIDVDLLPCDGSLAALNLQDAQFKEELTSLQLTGILTINDNQSVMIESFLESTSLKELFIESLAVKNASVTAFRRIILACSKVEELFVWCSCPAHCDSVATLMGDSRSILSEVTISGMGDRGLSLIAEGLVNNTTLKTLKCLDCHYLTDTSPIAKALCETSSIERVIASNHTLEEIFLQNKTLEDLLYNETLEAILYNETVVIRKYSRLNAMSNEELVIRTKIARYYFQDEFDISTFASMDVKCLPRVLSMIGGGETNQNAVSFEAEDAIYQQSAIFRLLKCIPDICNVSSRIVGKVEGLEVNDSCSKRQKVSK